MFLNKLKVATATLLIAGALFAGVTIMMSDSAPAALAAGGARGVKKDMPPDKAPPASGVKERAGGGGVVKVGNYVASLACESPNCPPGFLRIGIGQIAPEATQLVFGKGYCLLGFAFEAGQVP